jgi:hypothetical protein
MAKQSLIWIDPTTGRHGPPPAPENIDGTKRSFIWVNLNDPVDVAWLARNTTRKTDGTFGFTPEFRGL